MLTSDKLPVEPVRRDVDNIIRNIDSCYNDLEIRESIKEINYLLKILRGHIRAECIRKTEPAEYQAMKWFLSQSESTQKLIEKRANIIFSLF